MLKQRVEQPDIAVEGFTYHFLNFRDFQNKMCIRDKSNVTIMSASEGDATTLKK